MTRPGLPGLIREQRVIAVARRVTRESAAPLADALSRAGIGVLEITIEDEAGIGALARLEGSGIVVGAGTVTSLGQAAAAVDAGAVFLVSPHHDPVLTGWALDRGVPLIPGGLTPTEIHAAWAAGAPAVKVFPASVGGPELIAAIKAPFPDIELVPTGGITAANASAYLDAGALAVGVGGWLTDQPDLALVADRAAQLASVVGLV